MHRVRYQIGALFPHVLAAGAALGYAWMIAQTGWRTSGVQFVSPLVVILVVHLGWLALRRGLVPGFALHLYKRALGTAVLILSGLVLASVFAPQPAYADAGEVVGTILMVVFCAAMIAVVVVVVALALYTVFRIFAWLLGWSRPADRGPKGGLFDYGSLSACLVLLGVASLEGVPDGYTLATAGRAQAEQVIDAPLDHVWRAMGTATSPDFPLPGILATFPRPVEVAVDEGVGLGANRVVRFEGREGAGHLHLRVVERTGTDVVFAVLSDTSPYAGWIGYRGLTYRVVPEGSATRVSVSLDYERRLAPAWFFGPVMEGAAYLAVDVLARDVKTRSEQPGG